MTTFHISHTLDFKKGSLITTRNKLHDRVANLASKSFAPLHVRDESLINTGRNMQSVKAHQDGQLRGSVPTQQPVKGH